MKRNQFQIDDVLERFSFDCFDNQILVAQHEMASLPLPDGLRHVGKIKPCKKQQRGSSAAVLAYWEDTRQIALRYPYVGLVISGEADLQIDDTIIACPAGYGIFIPPNIAICDGTQPHWTRERPEHAASDIFWLSIRPSGAEGHLCHTFGERHFGGGYGERGFAASTQLLPLCEMIIHEFNHREPNYLEIANGYWKSMIGLVKRHWTISESSVLSIEENTVIAPTEHNPTLERICRYIEDNLDGTLTLQEIAHAAYISRASLARLFQEKKQMTVWQYVTQCRIEKAKSLLIETDLSIHNISRLIGFKHDSHFCTRFVHVTGQAPGEFRQKHKNNVRLHT